MAAFEQLAFGFDEGPRAAVPIGNSAGGVASPPAPPPAPTPAPLSHPQASREVVLAGQRVRYAFRRGKRRTIGFVV
ncbi:MAG: metal-dependent hydrolase, partial [Betaproteobacteria bacterium]